MKIETGVAIPPRGNRWVKLEKTKEADGFDWHHAEVPGVGRPTKFPVDALNISESLFLPSKDLKHARLTLLTAAQKYAKYHGLNWVFTTRTYKNGVRIWRVK